MNKRELAVTVLSNLEQFYVLQELQELLSRGDVEAKSLMDRIYRPRNLPCRMDALLHLESTLSVVFVPLSLLISMNDEDLNRLGFSYFGEYGLELFKNDERQEIPAMRQVLLTMRHAIAHLSDYTAEAIQPFRNISFPAQSTVRFSSHPSNGTEYSVIFRSKRGYVSFMNQLLKTARTKAREMVEEVGGPE